MAKKKKPRRPIIDLSGIVKGIGDIVELAERLSEFKEKTKEIKGKKEFEIAGKRGKIGYSFHIGSLRGARGRPIKPRLERFGHKIKKTPKGPRISEECEPFVDIFEEKEFIRVVAELPGAKERDISIDLKENELLIKSDTPGGKYRKLLKLPCAAERIEEKSYKNGVLNVKLKKSGEKK